MLTRATFENFKALRDVAIDLTPFTVIVGKNGAGKSSVLEAIHDLVRVPRAPTKVFMGSHDPRRIVTRPRTGPMRIAVTDADGGTFALEARFEAGDDGEDRVALSASLGGSSPESIALAEPTADSRRFLRRAGDRYGSAVFLRLDARVMARESVASSDEPRLEYDGEGLATVLNSMAGAAPDVLEEIRRDLTAVVPQVRGIRTFPARITRRQRERITVNNQAIYQTLEEEVPGHRFALDMGGGRVIEADLLSEGTVLALGLLTALRHPKCPRLVLLDDVEAALHSAAQAELVRAIRAILATRPEVQIICSSHSPDLLDNVSLEEIRVMALDREGYARCGRLVDHPESERWRTMLRTGEFWASVGEDWLLEGPRGGA